MRMSLRSLKARLIRSSDSDGIISHILSTFTCSILITQKSSMNENIVLRKHCQICYNLLMKFIQWLLLGLIIIGIGLLITKDSWVPKVVDYIMGMEAK